LYSGTLSIIILFAGIFPFNLFCGKVSIPVSLLNPVFKSKPIIASFSKLVLIGFNLTLGGFCGDLPV